MQRMQLLWLLFEEILFHLALKVCVPPSKLSHIFLVLFQMHGFIFQPLLLHAYMHVRVHIMLHVCMFSGLTIGYWIAN